MYESYKLINKPYKSCTRMREGISKFDKSKESQRKNCINLKKIYKESRLTLIELSLNRLKNKTLTAFNLNLST